MSASNNESDAAAQGLSTQQTLGKPGKGKGKGKPKPVLIPVIFKVDGQGSFTAKGTGGFKHSTPIYDTLKGNAVGWFRPGQTIVLTARVQNVVEWKINGLHGGTQNRITVPAVKQMEIKAIFK